MPSGSRHQQCLQHCPYAHPRLLHPWPATGSAFPAELTTAARSPLLRRRRSFVHFQNTKAERPARSHTSPDHSANP